MFVHWYIWLFFWYFTTKKEKLWIRTRKNLITWLKTKVNIIPPAIVFFDCWNHQAFENLSVIDCFLVGCLNPMKLQPTMKQIRTLEWKGSFESSVDHSPLSLSGVTEPAQGHQSDFWYWDAFRISWEIFILEGEKRRHQYFRIAPRLFFFDLFVVIQVFFRGLHIEGLWSWFTLASTSWSFLWVFLEFPKIAAELQAKMQNIYCIYLMICYMIVKMWEWGIIGMSGCMIL